MKLIGCVFILLFSISVSAQRSLVVKRGQTKKITVPQRSLILDTLILEDNARLEIDTAVSAISIIAKYVVIGYNVVIDASSNFDLPNGQNGTNGNAAMGYCKEAGMGSNGSPGSKGSDAADIFLYLRIRSIGSLNIDAKGGNGTSGGNGGNGGAGANSDPNVFSNCKAKAGGRGGNGGSGGMGGRGATVLINYTFIDPAGNVVPTQPSLNAVDANVKGGSGGAGGVGGQKGPAGRKTNGLIDPMLNQNVPNALSGTNGANGSDGRFIKVAMKQNL